MNAERSRRAWLLRIGGTLLFLALIAFLVWSGQLKPIEILHVLAGADLPLVLLSVVIYFPFVLIKSERWRLLAARLGVPMTTGEAWRLYAVGLGNAPTTIGLVAGAAADRFDFPSVALLPDGRIAVSFQDATTPRNIPVPGVPTTGQFLNPQGGHNPALAILD